MLWWLVGCAPATLEVVGTVSRDGERVADVEVVGGAWSTTTDATGRFALTVEGGEAPPVAAITGDARVADLSCVEEVGLDLTAPVGRPTGTLALVLRQLPEDVDLYVRFTVVEGTDREPVQVPVEIPDGAWTRDGASTWTRAIEVPATGRWAITVSSLREARLGGDVHRVLDQVLAVGGDALAPGEVRYLEAFMSDETLRDVVYWDTTGPGGVQEARFQQLLEVQGIGVELTTWRGPVRQPIPVPVVQLFPGDELLGVRGTFSYAGVDDCSGRVVEMDPIVREADVPRRVIEPGSTSNERVRVKVLTFPEPFPPPPSVTLRDDGALSWAFVPLEDARLSLTLDTAAGPWRGAGRTGCMERRLVGEVPPGAVRGRFLWSRFGERGWCDIGGGE